MGTGRLKKILITANTSRYLWHYRKLLIEQSRNNNNFVITLAPFDNCSENLSSISEHINWEINPASNINPFKLFIDFLKFYKIITITKPDIIHSHTLRVGLINTLCSFLTCNKSIVSITGLGRLKTKRGNLLLKFILKTIYFFSKYQIQNIWKISNRKTYFIFQNEIDKSIFLKVTKAQNINNFFIIKGSGVPLIYETKIKKNSEEKNPFGEIKSNKIKGFIFCGRLLKSKGIDIFIELAKKDIKRKYKVFGEIDKSSKDSLTELEKTTLSKKHKNIEFFGHVKNPLFEFFNKPYVLIVPSNYGEGMPRAIAEALILGIPVIASKKAVCSLYPKNIIFESEEVNTISYSLLIKELENDLKNNLLRNRIKKGRKYVIENFMERQIVNQTLDLYKDIYT